MVLNFGTEVEELPQRSALGETPIQGPSNLVSQVDVCSSGSPGSVADVFFNFAQELENFQIMSPS